ncbi:hypothetical protein [Mesorhizobium sp. WSM3626]|nr:hypothetical protein [Mesorhizobium sp. WSM3626]
MHFSDVNWPEFRKLDHSRLPAPATRFGK